MIILRTKRFTYIGKTGKDEYTHLLGEVRDAIYNHPGILREIGDDAESLGYQRDDFIREMGIVSRKHVDPDKILLQVKHSRSDKTLTAYISDNNISLNQYKEISEQRLYSRNRIMIDRITKKLDNAGLDDYDIDSRVPGDTISVSSDLGNLKIYIPHNIEYFKYDLDDFIRGLSGVLRTKTSLDGDVYAMSVYGGRLTEDQYFKLLKFIIEEEEFVTILEEENR